MDSRRNPELLRGKNGKDYKRRDVIPNMRKELVTQVSTFVTAAFGFVAALAWNNAVQSLFAVGGALHFMADYGPWAYAIFVTAIAVLATVYLGKLAEKAKK